jgi:imidazolonepropionase-like amidohydrolase
MALPESAEIMGAASDIGTIAPNRVADVILVNGTFDG